MVGILVVSFLGFRLFSEDMLVSGRVIVTLDWLFRAELPNRQVPIKFRDCRIPGTRQASCNRAASQDQEDGKLETAEQQEKFGWSCLKGLDMVRLQAWEFTSACWSSQSNNFQNSVNVALSPRTEKQSTYSNMEHVAEQLGNWKSNCDSTCVLIYWRFSEFRSPLTRAYTEYVLVESMQSIDILNYVLHYVLCALNGKNYLGPPNCVGFQAWEDNIFHYYCYVSFMKQYDWFIDWMINWSIL